MLTKVRTSLSFGSTRQEKVERMKVSDVVRSVLQRRSSHSEQGRMMAFLKREFPLSFERFLRDHGGSVPHIPLQVPVNHVITRGDMESKEDGPDVLIETEAAVSTLMCSMPTMSTQRNFDTNPEEVETAVASDVWALVTGAFCLSTPPQYLPQDDQRTESDNQTNEKAIPKSHSLLQHSESVYRKLNPLNMLNPGILSPGTPTTSSIRNPLVFQQRPGVDYRTQRDLLFEDLASESQRIMKLYCGITRERGTTFNWILKKAQDDINVHNCDLPGSSFSALKSDCFVKKDKYTILKYLTDDDRSKEYDETLDGYKLLEVVDDHTRIRRYYYKGIWPCSARDFILFTTWKELEDGSILISTISPPDEFYPDNDGYVRASIICSGMLVRPIDPKLGGNGCHITVIGHSDLKGNIPSMVINQLASGIPYKFVKKFKEVVEKSR